MSSGFGGASSTPGGFTPTRGNSGAEPQTGGFGGASSTPGGFTQTLPAELVGEWELDEREDSCEAKTLLTFNADTAAYWTQGVLGWIEAEFHKKASRFRISFAMLLSVSSLSPATVFLNASDPIHLFWFTML